MRLTNRGGAIAEMTLPNHKAIEGPVMLNHGNKTPVTALVADPAAPVLPEYKATRTTDGVQYEYVGPQQVIIRKKYSSFA